MKRRKTVSVTPAIGARTVAGAICTLPIDKDAGTRVDRMLPSAAGTALPGDPFLRSVGLSQNFFTGLFYFDGCCRGYIPEGGLYIPWG